MKLPRRDFIKRSSGAATALRASGPQRRPTRRDEMARMFCYEPVTGEVKNLGVAVSVLERRRYGYVFGDAVTGRDGQILFGENDDLGHLWLYFPRIQADGRADSTKRSRA